MIKILLSFLLVWFLVTIGISSFRAMTEKDRWSLTKTLTYSFITAIIAGIILTTIVILF